MRLHLEPFRHFVLDGFTTPDPLPWPAAQWVEYDSPFERKRACNDYGSIQAGCRRVLADMLTFPVGRWLGLDEPLFSDATFHGAGCHEMGPGGFLSLHLDSDHHPGLDLERRANAIMFMDEWRPEWGGELELWATGAATPSVRIEPARGRLVVFECGDHTPHSVARVTCPEGVRRRSLSAFWFGRPRGKRPRALFLPVPGETPDPAREELRRQRAGK